jgi:hypothetical protein
MLVLQRAAASRVAASLDRRPAKVRVPQVPAVNLPWSD